MKISFGTLDFAFSQGYHRPNRAAKRDDTNLLGDACERA
jgi:hypothetical protein